MKKLIISTISLISVISSFGQDQFAITEDGKKVILSNNGTWKYLEEVNKTSDSDSSDCSKWISTTTDKMTGESSTAATKYLVVTDEVGNTGFKIIMMTPSNAKSKKEMILSIKAVGAEACIDEKSKINILFEDGTRLQLTHDSDFNCKGNATVYFGGVFGKEKELKQLKSKKISALRVWTGSSYIEKEFTEDNKEEFYHVINCLTEE